MNASARARSPEVPVSDAELVRTARAGQVQAPAVGHAVSWTTPKLLWALAGLGAACLAVCVVSLVALMSATHVAEARSDVRASVESDTPAADTEAAQSSSDDTSPDADESGGVVHLGPGRVGRTDEQAGLEAAHHRSEQDAIRTAPLFWPSS